MSGIAHCSVCGWRGPVEDVEQDSDEYGEFAVCPDCGDPYVSEVDDDDLDD